MTIDKVNQDYGKYQEKQGLERAIQELLEFEKKHKRKPTTKDSEMWGITRAINRREWEDEGITYWNDLQERVFGQRGKKAKYYVGKEGLERAKLELLKIQEKLKKKPTSKDKKTYGMRQAVKRGEFIPFGIKSWNDLMEYTFGEINLQYGHYDGKDGLIRIQKKLKEFQRKNNRLPKVNDIDMAVIEKAAIRGKWKDFGISSWDTLLLKTFGKVNKTGRKKKLFHS